MNETPSSFQSLVDIVARLRSPDGCPWDLEQTHASLKRNLLEECYEALEAIDGGDKKKLSEELGDILVQVVFHSQIGQEAGTFGIEEVVSQISRKLVRRHPHVFGDAVANDAREVELNWDRLKQQESPARSPAEGFPKELPALAYAQLMQDRVARVGFEWEDVSGVLDKVAEEVSELKSARSDEERAREFGDLLFTMVNMARWLNIHAEDTLRQANARFQRRYTTMERLAAERGFDFAALPLDSKEALWQEAKSLERD